MAKRKICASCARPIKDRPKRGCKYPEIHNREQWKYRGLTTLDGHEYYQWQHGKERYYWLASDYRTKTVQPIPIWGGTFTSTWCDQCHGPIIMYPTYGAWIHTDPTPDPHHTARPIANRPTKSGYTMRATNL